MRKPFRYALSAVAAFTLVAAACTGDDDDDAAEDTEAPAGTEAATEDTAGAAATTAAATEDTVDATQGADVQLHVITHGGYRESYRERLAAIDDAFDRMERS